MKARTATVVGNPTPAINASFSLRNRFVRWVWGLVYCSIFRTSPRSMHALRSALLRLFGAQLGENCHIYPKAVIWAPWNLVCGNHTGIADGVIVYNQAMITLGCHVTVSQGAHLCTGTHDYEDRSFRLVAKPITVGDDAWVCAEAFIHPGITIGKGAVIGARSVVTRDVEPWSVVSGFPAVKIRERVLRS